MRLMHTMVRVGNLDKSLEFYQNVLKMKIFKQKDYTEGRFTLVFLGYGDSEEDHLIELTYNWDKDHYEIGNGYGHIAIACSDIYKTCQEIESKGGRVTRAPGPMKGSQTILAFVEDPDGYKIELIQKA
ncbi:MAG: lactoylglutathione lyase [Chlamydiales bacterium]|nr:lactoylglutathione lyase [Chlamydiales bacterium]NCF71427.1 lactoylglutathione lyase [Chlamydiales bacterium]